MGWIETYVDPENVRGYWEGWVAISDKTRSAKYNALVTNSEHIIPHLPWPASMEKDSFLAPDFTSLDMVTYASYKRFVGINIPNYDDIREQEGFKNVELNNCKSGFGNLKRLAYCSQETSDLIIERGDACYDAHLACHELLGHGSGKLTFRESEETPYFTDPATGETYQSCYEKGETWTEKFGSISTAFEECRADSCGLHLVTLPQVYELFGFAEEDVETLLFINLTNYVRKGICGLPLYNKETGKWGQAHTQGAFVFTQYVWQNQKNKLLSVDLTETSFTISIDRQYLMDEGRQLISDFLLTL